MNYANILKDAGLAISSAPVAGGLTAHTPIDGSVLGYLPANDTAAVEASIQASARAFLEWRAVPAPARGELVRRFADHVRRDKQALGRLISLEYSNIYFRSVSEESVAGEITMKPGYWETNKAKLTAASK